MFSPYYRRAGHADPADHVAMNLCLYGPAPRWTMTERGRDDLVQNTGALAVGRSALRVDGDAVVATIAERATPLPRPARGTVRIHPEAVCGDAFPLDPAGRHVWRPLVPAARVEVTFDDPSVQWSGHGYVDSNFGTEPLAAGFRGWDWSRSRLAQGSAVLYEGVRADGDPFALALRFGSDGAAEPVPPPPPCALRRTNWLLPRRTRAEAPGARIVRTLEDTPFYTRTVLAAPMFGEVAPTMHESVDFARFTAPWVQHLLPYRMPRRPLRSRS